MSDERILLNIMNDKIDRLVDLNEKQNEKLSDHDVKLAEYNASLNEHMRRTELLEMSLDEHRNQSNKSHASLHEEIKPLLERESFKKQLKKYIIALGAISGALFAMYRFLGTF